jgi:hypothetical protein
MWLLLQNKTYQININISLSKVPKNCFKFPVLDTRSSTGVYLTLGTMQIAYNLLLQFVECALDSILFECFDSI